MDKLKPETTPNGSESVLWFEFLLHPNLLEKHLSDSKPDPPPVDLISKFLGLDQKNDSFNTETEKLERDITPNSFKAVALKILTMKVVAYLKWDLDVLGSKFSPKIILQLLLDLLSMAKQAEIRFDQELLVEYDKNMNHQCVFAVHLFHRWVLKAVMDLSLVWKQPRILYVPAPSLQEPNTVSMKKRDDLRLLLGNHETESIAILRRMMVELESFTVPTIDSFIQPTETSEQASTKWKGGKLVSLSEFKCQIHFELAKFLLFRMNHEEAHFHVKECLALFETIESQLGADSYCHVDKKTLLGFAVACNVPFSNAPSSSLIERFRDSKWNHFKDIISILQTDNLLREIPIVERDVIEVELQQAIGGGSFTVAKDLLMKMQVLNAIRRIMSLIPPSSDLLTLTKTFGDKSFEFFLTSIYSVMFDVPEQERKNLRNYLFETIVKSLRSSSMEASLVAMVLADEKLRSEFSQRELDYIASFRSSSKDSPASSCISQVSFEPSTGNLRLEQINIEHMLADSIDSLEIRKYLQMLIKMDPKQSWFRCNTRWDVPIPLQSVIFSLPKGFVQDFIFILVAKSKELSSRKDYVKAINLLEVADREAQEFSGINQALLLKLSKLIGWEALVLIINQHISAYPNYSEGSNRLKASCKACLTAASAGESVIPRLEVMESCAIALLNLCQWDYLIGIDRRLVYMELAAALASACQDLTKYKGSKKLPREAWDLILPVFGNGGQKRNNAGSILASGGSSLTRGCLMNFLLQLRESTVITVATSLLARMHNILRDEPSLEINCIHSGLWPAMISNSNSYSYKMVSEVLQQLTKEALTFMPNNFAVLKLMGDLSFASTDWAEALRHYLEAIAVGSDYFTQPIVKPVIDDLLVKRMIRCCNQLNCYTQAAVLCQCLDEVDYATAFRCLAETKNLQCADAMDAYYPCIWDITILEYLANHHSKRGETHRKQQVVKLMGLLELNSNNNEEIQNEAAKIRKNKLLRALLQQYCVSNLKFVGQSER